MKDCGRPSVRTQSIARTFASHDALCRRAVPQATGIVFTITGASDMTLQEVNEAAEAIYDMYADARGTHRARSMRCSRDTQPPFRCTRRYLWCTWRVHTARAVQATRAARTACSVVPSAIGPVRGAHAARPRR